MILQDRVAFVTGGGFGIGRAYSLGIAREGGKVVIADINDEGSTATAYAIEKEGGEALIVHRDVSDQAGTQAMARAAIDRFGKIDILVNNAAYFTTLPLRELDEIEVEEWDRVMAINLRGPFLCVKAVVPQMRAQSYGKINISSDSIMAGNPKRIHYVTSKAGLLGFTRSLARALGEHHIAVNTIMPGSTASEGAIAAYGPEFFQRQLSGNKAFKSIQQPEDLVGAVIFLSSDYSDYITGQTLAVNGGTSMY